MTVTMTGSKVPLAGILANLVSLDLNAVAMSYSQKFGKELFIDLGDVLDDKRLYTFAVECRKNILACTFVNMAAAT